MKKLFSFATLFFALTVSVISCKKDTDLLSKRNPVPVNPAFKDTPWIPNTNPAVDTPYLSNPTPPADTPYIKN